MTLRIIKSLKVQKVEDKRERCDSWHLTKHSPFTVTLSWNREVDRGRRSERYRDREGEREKLLSQEIALHSPSSLQVCFPLLLSWMSTIRHAQLDSCQMCGLALRLLPTGDWALSCVRMCTCVRVCVCIYPCTWEKKKKKKRTSSPCKELPTQNDRCQQTNTHIHTRTHARASNKHTVQGSARLR